MQGPGAPSSANASFPWSSNDRSAPAGLASGSAPAGEASAGTTPVNSATNISRAPTPAHRPAKGRVRAARARFGGRHRGRFKRLEIMLLAPHPGMGFPRRGKS